MDIVGVPLPRRFTGKGVEAVQIATRPLLGRLVGVTEGAERAEAALRQVVSWASWRLLGWIMALMVALVLLGWLTGNAVVWWDTGTVNNLQSEISELQANRDAFVRAGMLGKLTYCGQTSRPCIQVNENAGAFGSNGDYQNILGY